MSEGWNRPRWVRICSIRLDMLVEDMTEKVAMSYRGRSSVRTASWGSSGSLEGIRELLGPVLCFLLFVVASSVEEMVVVPSGGCFRLAWLGTVEGMMAMVVAISYLASGDRVPMIVDLIQWVNGSCLILVSLRRGS